MLAVIIREVPYIYHLKIKRYQCDLKTIIVTTMSTMANIRKSL